MRQIEALSAISKSGSGPGSVRFALVFAVFLFGAGFGAFAYRVAATWSVSATVAPQAESGPQLVRQGERIVIGEGSPLRSDLTIDVVGQKEIERNLVLPAAVEADPARLVKVLPPLSGRVMQLKVQLGEQVEEGNPLLVFDSPDLLTAYADYDRAKVVLALALKNRDRLRELARTGGAASKDQQQAETDYVTAEVEQQRTESRLKQIGVDPETTNKSRTVTIAAPISGSVIDLAAAPGAYWNDTTAPLMTVADLSSIWVTANVPEKDTSLVSKGQNADVVLAAYPRETLKGQVLFVSNVLDPDTRRTKVRIAFQNPGARLKPGMFANVTFFAPKQMAPIVPTTALVLKDDVNQVFVEVAPWTFEARPVEVGFQQGDLAVIQSGVKTGDRVVVKGGVLLND
jgi:cobalt-zinc-cadmium efflux system membrane fusion protein